MRALTIFRKGSSKTAFQIRCAATVELPDLPYEYGSALFNDSILLMMDFARGQDSEAPYMVYKDIALVINCSLLQPDT